MLFIAVCHSAPSGKIVNGHDADPKANPWQLSLQYSSTGAPGTFGHICGAALIAPDVTLTAAHCVSHE